MLQGNSEEHRIQKIQVIIMDYVFEVSPREKRSVFIRSRVIKVNHTRAALSAYDPIARGKDGLGDFGVLFDCGSPGNYADGIGLHFYEHSSGLGFVSAYAESEQTAEEMVSDFMRVTNAGENAVVPAEVMKVVGERIKRIALQLADGE